MRPTKFKGNINGECFTTEHPMDSRMLLSAAALVVYENQPISFALDGVVNVISDDHEEGSGSITVREVLEWALTNDGYAAIRKDHYAAADDLKRMAADLLHEG